MAGICCNDPDCSKQLFVKETYPKIYLYKRIVQAKLFIDAHYDEPIDLDNIADEACFSKFHFIRLFNSIYGCTPHLYLKSVRIENAKRFLREGIPVTETCYKVGFDSASSFAGLFRRHTGLSPSAYRQHHLLRQQQIKATPLSFVPACFAYQKGWLQKSNFEEVR
jgi:AraC-like DNA-binding protein